MIWLGIDTSCDDTSVAVTDGPRVLSNVISSQDDIHRTWGGVVPRLAQQAHRERFPVVLALALRRAGIMPNQIAAIAVTAGPGLAPALEVGLTQAKELSVIWQRPLYAVNHMEGHLLANTALTRQGRGGVAGWPNEHDEPTDAQWPIVGVLVSGGHTELVLMSALGQYEIIGQTVDDALGEAFDKVARQLGLGFPGGALLAKLALHGNERAYDLPVAMRQSGDLNVSYSGLKTAMMKQIALASADGQRPLDAGTIADLAASFERAAIMTLMYKLELALKKHNNIRQIWLGGGAAVNRRLRREVQQLARQYGCTWHAPYSAKLCRDNGAMMAVAAHWQQRRGVTATPLDELDRRPQWRLGEE